MRALRERPAGLALVTGASSGIGEAFARHLARERYDLVLVARRKRRLDLLATALEALKEVDVEVLQADLTAEEGVRLVEGRLRAGDVDLLVNDAGLGTVGEFAELPIERELEEIDLNVRALVRLTHAALGSMAPRGRGGIINVGSMAAFQAVPYNATYAATKAFVLHFSEALHEEARPHGVTVTCLCPGPVRTEFQHVAHIESDRMPIRPFRQCMAGVDPDTVVEAALSGLRARRAFVIPGMLNQAIAQTARTGPRFAVRRLAGYFFQGFAHAPADVP